MSNQAGLVILLIYACGALVELLIRMSLGVPSWARPAFEQHFCLVLLQPVVFMLIPALLWPLVALYRLFRPLYDIIMERFGSGTSQSRADGVHGHGSPQGNPFTISNASITSLQDLEKQEIKHHEPFEQSSGTTSCSAAKA